MQLARMLYRFNTRDIPGKMKQMAAAVWLELRYSKHDILETYANLAPFGGNVQGVGAASLIYFRKPASGLTFAEALTLAVIPQAPQARGRAGRESRSLAVARIRSTFNVVTTGARPSETTFGAILRFFVMPTPCQQRTGAAIGTDCARQAGFRPMDRESSYRRRRASSDGSATDACKS